MKIRITKIILAANTLSAPFTKDREHQQIDLLNPPALLKGFTAHARPGSLLLLSPPGWSMASSLAAARDEKGPRTGFRFNTGEFSLRAEFAMSDDEHANIGKVYTADLLDRFDTAPFGPEAPPAAHMAPEQPGKAAAK